MANFGQRITAALFSVKGKLDQSACKTVTDKIIEEIGMTPVPHPVQWEFPLDGKGGVGITYIQPMTESFIVWDTWPDHNGAYLHVASCKPFWVGSVCQALLDCGLEVHQSKVSELSLVF